MDARKSSPRRAQAESHPSKTCLSTSMEAEVQVEIADDGREQAATVEEQSCFPCRCSYDSEDGNIETLRDKLVSKIHAEEISVVYSLLDECEKRRR